MRETNRFVNQVVVVTGASTGIGLAVARAFASAGSRLVLAARRVDRLQQVATELSAHHPHQILAVPCDVANRTEVEALMAQTVASLGRIDILVNNAGIGILGPVEVVQLADAKALFETNFFGTLNCCQAVLPYLKRQGGGQIINMASVAGLRGMPNGIYSASKAAVIALSDALRIELKNSGVSVTVLCPGRVRPADTAFFDTAKKYGPVQLYKSPELLTTQEVARVLLDAAAKRKRLVIFPLSARLLYFVDKFAPRLIDQLVYKSLPRMREN